MIPSTSLLIAHAAALAACSASTTAEPEHPLPQEVVPAVTPDTLPEWVYGDPDNYVSNSPVYSGTFLKNVVVVVFKSDASQAARQVAVAAIDGEVVGGIRLFGDDGDYYVLIDDPYPDVPGKALLEALATLDALPQVDLATPALIGKDVTPSGGKAKGRPPQAVEGAATDSALAFPPDSFPDRYLRDFVAAERALASGATGRRRQHRRNRGWRQARVRRRRILLRPNPARRHSRASF